MQMCVSQYLEMSGERVKALKAMVSLVLRMLKNNSHISYKLYFCSFVLILFY
jgi:hypothetical protein